MCRCAQRLAIRASPLHVLISIQALLSAPNPDDPLSEKVASEWKKDEAAALKTAKEYTEKYAKKK